MSMGMRAVVTLVGVMMTGCRELITGTSLKITSPTLNTKNTSRLESYIITFKTTVMQIS
jgi:hypothetical protein